MPFFTDPMDQNKKGEWKKYLIAFVITAILFLTAFYLSNFFSNKKIQEIRNIENTIAIDILSSETQFDLLEELSCGNVNDSILSQELNDLAAKIEFSEEQGLGSTEERASLKKYYSLLQIKDYLLMKKAEDKCNLEVTSIIYFYSNKEDCKDCEKQGYILTDIRQNYPNVRVYAFDYNLDLSALKALITIYKVKEPERLPALIVNGQVYYGLQEFEDIQAIAPEVFIVPEPARPDDPTSGRSGGEETETATTAGKSTPVSNTATTVN